MAGKYLHKMGLLLCAAAMLGCGGGGSSRRVERTPDPEIQLEKDRRAGKLPPPAAPAGKAAPGTPAQAGKAPATPTPAAAAKAPAPAATPAAAAKTAAPAATATAPAAAPTAPAAAAQPAAAAPAAAAVEAPAAVVAEAKIPDVPSAGSITIEPIPIDTPWSPEKKLEQTKLRMQKIVSAMHEYMKKEGHLPPDAIYTKSGDQPLLSWRVALLPYLGHEDLYAKFNLKVQWNSEAGNKKLITQIPPVYQCPWGTSPDSTMFVVPRSPRGLFPGVEGRDPKLATDDWSHTVALLLVDDARAVPWTKPEDFRLKAGGSPGMLGKMTGGFLAAFADGEVAWLSQAAGREKLPALFTMNGGEKNPSSTTVQAPEKAIEPLEKLARMGIDEVPEVPNGTLFPDFKKFASGSSEFTKPSSEGSGSNDSKDDNRAAIPNEDDVKIAKTQLAKVFKEEIEKLKKLPNPNLIKSETARMLLEKLDLVQSEPVQAYVVLVKAREDAMTAGNYSLAVQATQTLAERYQVDAYNLKAETLLKTADECISIYPQQRQTLSQDALWFVYKSLQQDDFKTATEMYKVIKRITEMETGGGAGLPRIISQGRVKPADIIGRGQRGVGAAAANGGPRTPQEAMMQKLQSIEKEIEARRKAYEKVPEALATLKKNPEDAEANLVVGRYKTLVKFDWKEGGKYLSKGSNLRLRVLAAEDAANPVDGKVMAELASMYMELAGLETGIHKRGLEMRALYWYQKAEPTVPGGFLKIQTEKNIKEITDKYSPEVVTEVMNIIQAKNE